MILKKSVVTTVLDGHEYIRETIESVLGQEGDCALESTTCDDGSTDGTLEVIDGYEGRCLVTSQLDSRSVEAINAGMRRAPGDVLCWAHHVVHRLTRAVILWSCQRTGSQTAATK
jgi:glycosyltransferase involved in cell wall biosynthesis